MTSRRGVLPSVRHHHHHDDQHQHQDDDSSHREGIEDVMSSFRDELVKLAQALDGEQQQQQQQQQQPSSALRGGASSASRRIAYAEPSQQQQQQQHEAVTNTTSSPLPPPRRSAVRNSNNNLSGDVIGAGRHSSSSGTPHQQHHHQRSPMRRHTHAPVPVAAEAPPTPVQTPMYDVHSPTAGPLRMAESVDDDDDDDAIMPSSGRHSSRRVPDSPAAAAAHDDDIVEEEEEPVWKSALEGMRNAFEQQDARMLALEQENDDLRLKVRQLRQELARQPFSPDRTTTTTTSRSHYQQQPPPSRGVSNSHHQAYASPARPVSSGRSYGNSGSSSSNRPISPGANMVRDLCRKTNLDPSLLAPLAQIVDEYLERKQQDERQLYE